MRESAFPGGARGTEHTYQCRRCKRDEFDPWAGMIYWRKAWQPTPIFLPGESHGQRSLAGYSPWGCKELNTTEALSTLLFLAFYFLFSSWKNLVHQYEVGLRTIGVHARSIHPRNGMLASLWVKGHSKERQSSERDQNKPLRGISTKGAVWCGLLEPKHGKECIHMGLQLVIWFII